MEGSDVWCEVGIIMVSEERGSEGFSSGQPWVVGLEPATQPAAHVHTVKGGYRGNNCGLSRGPQETGLHPGRG